MSEETSLSEQYKANGNSSYQNGQYKEAVEWYTKAITEDPENSLPYHNRAAAYLMLNSYSNAYLDSNKSIQLNPTYCKALLRYAKCCVYMGRIDDARQACASVRNLEPLHPDLPNQISQVDLLSNTYQAYEKQVTADLVYALHLISKCLEFAPASLTFNMKRLNLLIQLKRFTEAKQRVEALLVSNPECVEILYFRGLCLYYMDHSDKAISHFQHVLRLHPDHVETQQAFKRAKTLLRLKGDGNKYINDRRFSKAHATYTEALEIDSLHDTLNAKLLCNRAWAAFNLGKFEASIKDCDSAIALDKDYVKAYARKAKCLAALEQYEEAVELWTTVVQLDGSRENKQHLQSAKRALAKSKEIDYYKILGLKKTASSEEIKQAYKKQALQHHPDRHTNASEEVRQEQEQKFKEIGEAYSVLSDPTKREQYDNGVLSTNGCDSSQMHARNVFTQVFPGFTTNGSTVHFSFG